MTSSMRPLTRRPSDRRWRSCRPGLSIRAERVVFDDAQLVVQVLAVALSSVVDDRLARLSRSMPLAGEHLDVDDGAVMPGARAARCLHVEAFSPKIAQQQFSSGVSWSRPSA